MNSAFDQPLAGAERCWAAATEEYAAIAPGAKSTLARFASRIDDLAQPRGLVRGEVDRHRVDRLSNFEKFQKILSKNSKTKEEKNPKSKKKF